jgi:hypothetical protein
MRDVGSTARQPSSNSSMEKPLIGPVSPRLVLANWRAFCHVSASTGSDSFSVVASDVTSTSQRISRFAFRGSGSRRPWPENFYQGRVGMVKRIQIVSAWANPPPVGPGVALHSALKPSAGRKRAA